MDLKSRIVDDMKSAMRAKDAPRLETIRLIRAAIQRKELDDRLELDDQGVVVVLQKMLKQGRDSISQFEQGGREDLAKKEQYSVVVLQEYLPEPLSSDQLDALINEAMVATGAAEMRDMGKVMGWLKPKIDGRADMGGVSGKIKQRLSA
ncbi:MAG: hypothetical protein ACI8P9_001339 [Parasphingorhabdus sp.]|jgi:uncharacterized protein YqeY